MKISDKRLQQLKAYKRMGRMCDSEKLDLAIEVILLRAECGAARLLTNIDRPYDVDGTVRARYMDRYYAARKATDDAGFAP